MKNILVPIGTSKNTIKHLQYAVDFAKAFNANLFAIQVYNVYTKAGTMIKVDHILERESKIYLEKLISEIDTKGVNIITRVLKGKLIDTIELVCNAAEIDLILIAPKTNSKREELFLGNTSGKIIKRTQIPALIVPEAYTFKPIKEILMAVKSAIMKNEKAMIPLQSIQNQFNAKVDLLLVKTPYYNEGDFGVNDLLKSVVSSVTQSENATTYQGVLEYYHKFEPDMLCVVRRKRGFFMKTWEKNTISKKDFSSKVPVLVLSEMK